MKTNAPKSITWMVATVIGVLGIVSSFVAIPTLSAYSFWLVVVGFVVLSLACAVKGL